MELNPALCAVELNPALCSVVLNPALCSVALCAVELNPALCSVALNPALCAIAFDSVSSLRFEEESPVPSQEAPLTSHEALLPFQEAPLPVKEAPLPFKKAPMSYMALIYRTTVTIGLVVTFSSHRLLIGDMASPPALNRCGPAILQQLSFVHVLYVTTLAALAVYSAINPWSCDLMLMPHNSHHVGGLLRLLALQCAASSPVVWPHNSHHVGDFVAVSYSSHQLLIGDMASPAWNRFQSQPVAVTGGAVDVLLPEGALTDGGAASPGGVSAPGSPDLRFVASRHLSVANDAVPVASPAVVPASPYVAISENSLFDAYDPDQNWDATNGLDTSASSEYFDGDDPDLQSWFPSQLTSDRSSPQPRPRPSYTFRASQFEDQRPAQFFDFEDGAFHSALHRDDHARSRPRPNHSYALLATVDLASRLSDADGRDAMVAKALVAVASVPGKVDHAASLKLQALIALRSSFKLHSTITSVATLLWQQCLKSSVPLCTMTLSLCCSSAFRIQTPFQQLLATS